MDQDTKVEFKKVDQSFKRVDQRFTQVDESFKRVNQSIADLGKQVNQSIADLKFFIIKNMVTKLEFEERISELPTK